MEPVDGRGVMDAIWDIMNKYHIIEFEKRIQNKILAAIFGEHGETAVAASLPPAIQAVVTPPPAPSDVAIVKEAAKTTSVSGFYKPTGPTELTFYATTTWPGFSVDKDWSIVGVTGIVGNLRVSTQAQLGSGVVETTALTSEPYNWKFTFQTDTNQYIEGTTHVGAAFLYPPGQEQFPSQDRSASIYGYYIVESGRATFHFSAPPPDGMAVGWYVVGLPTIGASKISEINMQSGSRSLELLDYSDMSTIVFKPIDNKPISDTDGRVYVKGGPAMVVEPKFVAVFTPGTITTSDLSAMPPVEINPAVIGGKRTKYMRDLDTEIDVQPTATLNMIEVKGRGISTGSVLSLAATGPQDEFMSNRDYGKSKWNPEFKQHTNFVMYQRVIPFPPPSPTYQNQTIQLELLPQTLGHLLSNMYFKCTIPRAGTGYSINENIGRALIKQVDLLVNETVIETLYDDWYIIRDQVFLDADEQKGMVSVVGGLNSNVSAATDGTNIDVVCPLEFFFCRRRSHANIDRERLRKPHFPLCAMWNQKLYVRFTFHPVYWWSNATTNFDMTNPRLVTEEILLDNSEKLYYQNTPLRYIVPKVKKESTLEFSGGAPQLQLTANFPVQSLVWFFRNKNYESTRDSSGAPSGLYYDSRYNYGYTTDFIQTGVALAFQSSNNIPTNYADVIDTAKITLNNIDILSTFQGSLYYSYKQPMEHGLSAPSRNMYMYSFGMSPKEYNQGGFLDFSKLNSQTSTLTLNFNPAYTSQITQGYNLYLFYYGYTVLDFQNGFAHSPFA